MYSEARKDFFQKRQREARHTKHSLDQKKNLFLPHCMFSTSPWSRPKTFIIWLVSISLKLKLFLNKREHSASSSLPPPPPPPLFLLSSPSFHFSLFKTNTFF